MAQKAMGYNIKNNAGIITVPSLKLPYNEGIGTIIFKKMSENKDCIGQIASFLLGVKTASTDPAFSVTDTAFLLNQVKPKMIFAGTDAVQLIEDVIKQIKIQTEIVVFGDSEKYTSFSEFLKESIEEATFLLIEVMDQKETASIFFSSGTSGLPKGVCALLAQIPCTEYELPPVVFFSYATPCWISSFVFVINCIVQKNGRLVAPRFNSDMNYSLINEYQVGIMYLVSSQLIEVVNKKRSEARNMFPTTFVGMAYGLTELGGMVIGFPNSEDPKLLRENPTSSGRPQQGRSYKIVDPETEEILGINQQRELRIKTEYKMNGYYDLDSSKEWDSDGFLKTGDIAYYDKDHCFYIVDRIKEMLKYKNYHISPAKLEGILMNHPAVESVVVVGLPHPLDGDHPLGIIVLKRSIIASEVTPEQIKNYLNDSIDDDKQKLRGGVKIVDTLPKTPTGKFSRIHAKNVAAKKKL